MGDSGLERSVLQPDVVDTLMVHLSAGSVVGSDGDATFAALDLRPLAPPARPPPSSPPLRHFSHRSQPKQSCLPGEEHTHTPAFRPRELPPGGLLFVAPSARTSMGYGAVGSPWSLGRYQLVRKLHEGYASSVYKATCLHSGHPVVLKLYALPQLSDFLRHQVLRELDIHSRLKHPDLVALLAAFRDGDVLALVLEYVRGGSLDVVREKLGGRLSEQQAVHLVLLPLLRALRYMHGLGVVHRDVKPDNVLFSSDWRLKLCDFGVSVCLHEERAVTRAGSSQYMGPEVHRCPLKEEAADNKGSGWSYGTGADVWSVGVLLYEILVGFTPFSCAGGGGLHPSAGDAPAGPPAPAAAPAPPMPPQQAQPSSQPSPQPSLQPSPQLSPQHGTKTSPLPSPQRSSPHPSLQPRPEPSPHSSPQPCPLRWPKGVSAAARDFVASCLMPDPADRPTVQQLLQHSWVKWSTHQLEPAPAAKTAAGDKGAALE
ncbi:putative spindle assembly checkpoint kinase, partial [Tetrabaena socialis]